MTPSNELFELIRSMNQTEKTYFKKYSRLHTVGKENSYLLLFDAICRQKEYDEAALLQHFREHYFVKHFAVVKNYLHSRILDALENYHRDLNINTKVRRAINRAELLHTKGLYEQSLKMTEKAKRTAEESGLSHALLEIYSTLDLILYSEKNDFENLEAIFGKVTDSISSVRENMLCHNLSVKMVKCYRFYFQTRHEKYLREAKQLMRSALYKEAAKAKTYMGKLRFSETNFYYAYMVNDLACSYKYESEIVSLFESNQHYLKSNVKKYIAALNNLFVISMEQGQLDYAAQHLQQLKTAIAFVKTRSQRSMHCYFHTINSLHYLCRSGKISENEKEIFVLFSGIEEYENEFSPAEKIDLLIHFAISYYYTGNLKKCISFLNKIRNEFNLSDNPEVQSFFYVFYLVVHYDAGNRDILFSAMQAFYRFLHKKEKISALEEAIIVLLRRQSTIDSGKKVKEEFIRFKELLDKNERSYLDKYIFKYFDFTAWLESKIKGKEFTAMIKEQ